MRSRPSSLATFLAVFVTLLVAFQNFSSCSAPISFSDSEIKEGKSYRGGNGEPTDGKPGTYYRWVPDFKCKGKPTLVGELQIAANRQMSAKILDQDTCELVSRSVSQSETQVSSSDPDLLAYGSGIYVHSESVVSPRFPPSVAREAFCQSRSGPSVDLVVKQNTATSALTVEAVVAGVGQVGPFVVGRQIDARSVLYRSSQVRLSIDRVGSLSAPEALGRLQYLEGSGSKGDVELSCRMGARFDVYNHFAPQRQLDFFGPTLPSGFTLARAGLGSYIDASGTLRYAPTNAPRFEFDSQTGLSKGLLIERSSANLLLHSQDFQNWNVTGYNSSVNTAESPAITGALEAELFRNTNTVSQHQVMQRMTLRGNTFHTFSLFIKPALASQQRLVRLQIIDEASFQHDLWATFDILAGTVVMTRVGGEAHSVSAGVERHANGWLRLHVSGMPTASARLMQVFFESLDAPSSTGVYADPNQSGYYAFGAQLEESEVMTSYIPTATSAVARAADVLSSADLTWWSPNAIEGTLMLERRLPVSWLAPNPQFNQPDLLLSLSSGNFNSWLFTFDRNSSALTSEVTSGGGASQVSSIVPNLAGLGASQLTIRTVASFAERSMAVTVNGGNSEGSRSGGPPDVPSQVILGSASAGPRSSYVQMLRYWPFQIDQPIRERLSTQTVPQ